MPIIKAMSEKTFVCTRISHKIICQSNHVNVYPIFIVTTAIMVECWANSLTIIYSTAGGPLVPESIIRPVVSASALT